MLGWYPFRRLPAITNPSRLFQSLEARQTQAMAAESAKVLSRYAHVQGYLQNGKGLPALMSCPCLHRSALDFMLMLCYVTTDAVTEVDGPGREYLIGLHRPRVLSICS